MRADDLATARDDLIDRLLAGKTADGTSFADILDSELDAGTIVIAKEIAPHLLGLADPGMGEHVKLERQVALQKWVRALAEKWVDSKPDLIRSRAAELLASEEA